MGSTSAMNPHSSPQGIRRNAAPGVISPQASHRGSAPVVDAADMPAAGTRNYQRGRGGQGYKSPAPCPDSNCKSPVPPPTRTAWDQVTSSSWGHLDRRLYSGQL